jgi:hypothetical protein
MYFWKIEKLKNDLLIKPLSESESFKYLFAIITALSLIGILDVLVEMDPTFLMIYNKWDVFSSINDGLINAIGVYYVYKCNKGANGDNFLQKFLSIGWVVGIRWLVIYLPLIVIFSITHSTEDIYYSNGPYDVILYFIMGISYYWLLGKHVKEVAK